MDVLLEFVVQLLVQLVVEVIGELFVETAVHGIADVLRSRVGRGVLAALAGFGFGVAWGNHLSGHASWPKLLWVSLALAAVALVAAVVRASRPVQEGASAGEVLAPPWRWPADRLLGLVVLNLAIAGGIALSFTPAG